MDQTNDKPKLRELQKLMESVENSITPQICNEFPPTDNIMIFGHDKAQQEFVYNLQMEHLITDWETFKQKCSYGEIYEIISNSLEDYLNNKYNIEVDTFEWSYI